MKKKPAVKNSRKKKEVIKNDPNLSGFINPILGFNPGTGSVYDTTELSQANTLFKNNRWYLISNFRQLLCEIYVEHGLIQTVVDVPVNDALRGGVEIVSKQLAPEQIEELKSCMDREGDLETAGQAEKWNRLFGGAGVLILTDQKAEDELNIAAIGPESPLEFRAVDMWELFWDQQNIEGYDAEIQQDNFEFYNYYAKKVHKSRVMKLKGLVAPSFIRPRLRGWGFSIVELMVRSINQYLKATDVTFEVLDEFKIDIYKIKDLNNALMTNNAAQKIFNRVQTANAQKNFQSAIAIDSEDDFAQKELQFTGLAETMAGIRMQIASDLRMPITKIFGTSESTGFSTDQNDMENYNAMVQSQVRQKIKFHILKIIELRCQKLFGFIPDDVTIEFQPLRELTSEQEENVKTQKFNRLLAARAGGEISSKEFKDACNKDNLLGIQLDTSQDDLASENEAIEDDGVNEPDSHKIAPLK